MPYVGLVNNGNTCFINAIIQMLYRIPDARKIDIEPVKSFFAKMTLAEASATAAVNLELGPKSNAFECPLQMEKEKIGSRRAQKDAAEFLLNSILDKNEKLTLFNFELQTQSYCGIEGVIKHTQEPVRSTEKILSLELQKNSVQENIDLFLKDEPLPNDYTGCASFPGTKGFKKTSIESSHNHLILQLKRFGYDLEKIVKDIDINPVITLSGLRWVLQGAVLHTGTLSSGHYRYMWKEPTGNWILFDDSAVTPLTKENRITELKKNGYILVYKKISSKKTLKAVRFSNNAKKYNGKRATQKKKVKLSKKVSVKTQKVQTKKPPVKTQKRSKSFINSFLESKGKAEYKKSIYTNDPLLKELIDKYVKR